ncbi:MAG: type II toxin-antitoxin system RelE/ParE family toxin [bacterium]|nr:type II toxin-antitoxin system RelE/ParE family toxin [bacterium]
MREIDLSRVSEKYITKLPYKQRRQVVEKVFKLADDPQPSDASLLHGYKGHYRADISEYRIIYRFSSTTVYVALIGKRNDGEVYKKFKRMI